MIDRLIQKQISKLSIDDIISFASKENIDITYNESLLIYNYIKNDWKIILYGDSSFVFNDLKKQINPVSYNKINTLFNLYKNKYKNYL